MTHHTQDGKVYLEEAGQTKEQLEKELTRRQGKLAVMEDRRDVKLPARISEEEAAITYDDMGKCALVIFVDQAYQIPGCNVVIHCRLACGTEGK